MTRWSEKWKWYKFNSIRLIIFLHVKGLCLIYRVSLFKNDTVKNVDNVLIHANTPAYLYCCLNSHTIMTWHFSTETNAVVIKKVFNIVTKQTRI